MFEDELENLLDYPGIQLQSPTWLAVTIPLRTRPSVMYNVCERARESVYVCERDRESVCACSCVLLK